MESLFLLLTSSLGFQILLLGSLLGLAVWFYLKEQWALPPGPMGLPIVGYYPFLTSSPHLKLAKLAEKYGNVMSFNTTGKLCIHLNGLDVIKEVFLTRSEEFIGKPREMNFLNWIDGGLGIAQEEGPVWKEHRRFFLQAAKSFGFGKLDMETLIHDELPHLLNDLRKTEGKPTNLLLHMSHTTSSIISKILFRKRFDKEDPVFQKIAYGLNMFMHNFFDKRAFLVGPFFEHVMMKIFPEANELERTKTEVHAAINEIVDEHLGSFDKDNLRDVVDVYIEERRKLGEKGQLDKSTFTEDRLRALSMNMFMEGTVTSTLCALLKELSQHKKEQEVAQREIDEVVGKDRLPSWLDKSKLPYTDALVQELYRTSHPFNTTTFYSNYETTTLRGYKIPKRSIVIGNLWSISNDPKIFPNPEVFDPTRFLGPDGKRIKKEGPFPFGVGKRSCVAESLGSMEVFIIISSILQSFDLYPVEDKDPKFQSLCAVPRSKLIEE